MRNQDIDQLADILADQAANAFVGPQEFFRDLVNRAALPRRWTQEIAGVWKGDAIRDSRSLINWAIAKGVNPEDSRYTTLGSLLTAFLKDVGLDIGSCLVALIYHYNLYKNKNLLEDLLTRYQVPLPLPSNVSSATVDVGPEIDWQEPTEELELQGLFRPTPDFLDVGFLTRAIQQAASVCRIEIPERSPFGTGFLLTKDLLLTNYHVLKLTDDADIHANACKAVLRFGCFTLDTGIEAKGKLFKLDNTCPIVYYNPKLDNALLRDNPAMDYVLLRVENKIWQAKDIQPVAWDYQNLPVKQMGINLLQHPDGDTMKVTISSDGISSVYPNIGLIQYVTKTSGGSSGSPCFNDDWKVVALHHAEKSKYFGSIRQGILFSSIYQEIKSYLD